MPETGNLVKRVGFWPPKQKMQKQAKIRRRKKEKGEKEKRRRKKKGGGGGGGGGKTSSRERSKVRIWLVLVEFVPLLEFFSQKSLDICFAAHTANYACSSVTVTTFSRPFSVCMIVRIAFITIIPWWKSVGYSSVVMFPLLTDLCWSFSYTEGKLPGCQGES